MHADAAACDAVIASLPYHFGNEHGIAECAAAVRAQRGLAATIDGGLVGFCTWQPWFGTSRELTWLAVAADHRRSGIGTQLVEQLAADAAADGMAYLLVTTLSASVPEPGVTDSYAGTRRFYLARGFAPLWEPAGWWNGENQAVLMLRALRS